MLFSCSVSTESYCDKIPVQMVPKKRFLRTLRRRIADSGSCRRLMRDPEHAAPSGTLCTLLYDTWNSGGAMWPTLLEAAPFTGGSWRGSKQGIRNVLADVLPRYVAQLQQET